MSFIFGNRKSYKRLIIIFIVLVMGIFIGIKILLLYTNKYERVVLLSENVKDNITLSGKDKHIFERIINNAPTHNIAIFNPPDIVALAYKENNNEPDEYSIYLSENVIYEGFYLDAFSERMHGKKSKCLKMDDKSYNYFINILEDSKK